MTNEERMELISNVLKTGGHPERYLESWFDADFSQLKKFNVEQWIAWGMFGKRVWEMSEEELSEREKCLKVLEKEIGFPLPAGFNGRVQSLNVNFAPLDTNSRSIIFYFFSIFFLQKMLLPMLTSLLSFKKFTAEADGEKLDYYKRTNPDGLIENSSRTPIIFLHGIGVGPVCYFHFIYEIMHALRESSLQRDIIVVELKSVSQHFNPDIHDLKQFMKLFEAILDANEYKKCISMSHSYGSFPTSYMLREIPHRFESCVFLDPVSLFCHHTKSLKQVLFAGYPKDGTLDEKVGYLFTKLDLNLQRLFRREMHWWSHHIFEQYIPENMKCKVIMGREDEMIPVELVIQNFVTPQGNKMKRGNLEIIQLEDCDHGKFLKVWDLRKVCVEAVLDVCS